MRASATSFGPLKTGMVTSMRTRSGFSSLSILTKPKWLLNVMMT